MGEEDKLMIDSNEKTKSITIEQKLFAGLTIAALIFIFVTLLSFSGMQFLRDANDLVDHTQRVKLQINEVLAQVVDVETGTRGFIISGKDIYAEPLSKSSVSLPILLKDLRHKTLDNRYQQENLNLLENLVNERIGISDRLYQTRKEQGFERAISLFQTGKGKIITDSIRVLVDKMISEENQLMLVRLSNVKYRSSMIRIIIYISLAIEMLLLGFLFVFVKRDVSGRRKAEESLRQLNENLEDQVKERSEALQKSDDQNRLMIEGIRDYSILMLDVGGRILNWNTSCERMHGYKANEIIGKNFSRFYSNEDILSGKPKMELKEAATKGRYEDEGWRVRKDGSRFWANIIITALPDKNGQLPGFCKITRDITEQKKYEDELSKAKSEAEQANAAKSEFLSRMSHELRTPMNSILGFAQLMDMEELNPVHKKGVNQILKNGKHLLDLINEVLDISRIETGRLTISREPVETSNIISETIDIVRNLADENNISIESEAQANQSFFVEADHQRLKQVLLNLITNAVKYNRRGGSVKIETSVPEEEGKIKNTIKISITDTGNGISREYIKKLFKPFERIGAERTTTEVTGLGLAISKKLIEAMNGEIGVESEIGKGSTFWIKLQQTESQKDRYVRISELMNPEAEIKQSSGIILYIEDNLSNIQLVEQILETHRPLVKLITNIYGNNAVRLAIDYKPDLILLDLDLPDIHGSEVMKLLKAEPKTTNLPVIILSADAMSKQIKQLIKMGAKDYLIKPIDVGYFLKIVDDWVRRLKP